MNKYLKYLLSLFLAFALIANDGTIDSRKTADYYQSYSVVVRKEADLEKFRLYLFNVTRSAVKTVLSIPIFYLSLKRITDFQTNILVKKQILLHQNLVSFIKQAVFVNEIRNTQDLHSSLYIA
ncbi:hypothetical protein [Flavobacterium hercynium]|uniref:Uncharacterized protein n=1 Tax=Flavobacterium hercynium TaxID=387094 RepID=A0A226GXL4_9FLAO|nr:hypothetical protein [Flavobacterium hercynium]OXA86777.1 hypothetical protein B0A66_17405 [Flavobacterium hercynium]SMP26948.1 hypothetical protein SAMN06265346_11015 [Flavobacterium hercynium]